MQRIIKTKSYISNLNLFSFPQNTNPKAKIVNAIQYTPTMNECFATVSNIVISLLLENK